MKKLSLLFLLSILILACENADCDDEIGVCLPETESTWQLVEVLADPGNGSGTFNPVNSNRTITFFQDGTFSSEGSLCLFEVNNDGTTSGLINTTDSRLEFSGCNENDLNEQSTLDYELNGDELIIRFLCIEPCAWKFRRT